MEREMEMIDMNESYSIVIHDEKMNLEYDEI